MKITSPPNPPCARWIEQAPAPDTIKSLQDALGLGRVAASILIARGYSDPEAATEFVYPKLDCLHDPFSLESMDRAAERLWAAVRKRERVLLYGDYDVDGTCSIVVLKRAIEILGGCADFHVPHRLKDGYGMRSEVVSRAAETGVRLIVSVDTGIRANEVVRHANALGIDVIVTDHHLPERELPPALAVLNPNRPECRYPYKHLCGAGVTLKLIQALLSSSSLSEDRRSALLDSFLKPVAIATVADIVPLTGENRVIVKRGLSGLQQVRNPGLKALLSVAGLDDGDVPSAHQVAFRVAPRINAAGRMNTARDVIELFLTSDMARAQALAHDLDRLNSERQQVEAEIIETILKQCEQQPFSEDCAALVFSGSGWHLGVLGIVASRLVERFARPVFVLSESAERDEGGNLYYSGSGRSIPAFHLLEALESMPELFSKFGGHHQAAGLTLPASAVEQFRLRFDRFAAARLSAEDFRPEFQIDAGVSLPELTDRCAAEVLSLGPFGFGNPMPILCAREVEVAGPARASSNGKHLTIPLRQHGRTLFVKAWNFGHRRGDFLAGSKLDVLLQIEDDPHARRRGFGDWCLSLKDARSA